MTQSERWLKNTIKAAIFILPFLPFVVTDSLYFPFITGKNFVFRVIIEILLVLWVVLAIKNKKYLPGKSAVLWAVLAFFGALTLATVFSINPYRSFFSNAERMEGLFGLLHVLGLFMVTASIFNKKDWAQFFSVTLVAAVGVAIHGIGQLVGWFEIHQGGVRVDANFGNAAYFAGYSLFVIFFSLYLFTRVRAGEYVPFGKDYRKIWLWALGAVSVIYVVLLYLNQTRGAMLGLLGGLFVAALLRAIFGGKVRARTWSRGAVLVLVLIPLLFFAVKDTAWVQESSTLKRFADISMEDATTQARFLVWGMAVDGWQERPVFGWGPETFTTVFAQQYRPALWSVEPWYDRTHNVSLDWLVSAGILGFLAYHALFVVALWYLWRLRKRGVFTTAQSALFAGLLSAYFIHNFFVFDNVISYLFFFAVLGWLHVSYRGERMDLPAQAGGGPLIAGEMARNSIIALVALGVVASLYVYNIKPIKASGALLEALRSLSAPQLGTENIQNAHRSLERAIGFNTFVTTEAREQLLTKGTEDVSRAQFANAQDRRAYLDYADEQGEVHLEQFPHDMRMRTFYASFLVQVGKSEKGEGYALELVERGPTRPLFYLILGEAYLRQPERKEDEALEAFETAYTLSPDWPLVQEALAMGLIEAGRLERARTFLERQYGTAHPPVQRVIQAYISVGAYADAIRSAEALVEKEPDDIRWNFSLAKLYVHEFRDAEAIARLERVSELEPRLAGQMQVLIDQIRAGTINRNL